MLHFSFFNADWKEIIPLTGPEYINIMCKICNIFTKGHKIYFIYIEYIEGVSFVSKSEHFGKDPEVSHSRFGFRMNLGCYKSNLTLRGGFTSFWWEINSKIHFQGEESHPFPLIILSVGVWEVLPCYLSLGTVLSSSCP